MTVKQVYQCHGHLKHEITSLRSTKLTSFFQLSTYPSHVINAIYVSCFVFVNLRDKKIVSIFSFFPDSIKLHVIYVVLFVFILNPTPALMAFTEVTNVHVTSAQPTACRFQYSVFQPQHEATRGLYILLIRANSMNLLEFLYSVKSDQIQENCFLTFSLAYTSLINQDLFYDLLLYLFGS